MAAVKTFLTTVEHGMKESPLMTNVILSFSLAALEKITETEFACPCSPEYNKVFSTGFFLLPCVLVFLLMMITRDWGGWRDVCSLLLWKNIGISLTPAVVWLILIFMDGQYFACAKTSWSGRFVILDRAGPKKWCEPDNANFTKTYMIQTQLWFSVSQGIGLGITIFLAITFLIYTCRFLHKLRKGEETTDQRTGQNADQQHQEASLINCDAAGFRGGAADGNSFELQNENENSS